MNKIKKFSQALSIFLIFAVTQSGCLCGIAFWPLWIAGSGVVLTGAAMTGIGVIYHHDDLARGGFEIALAGSLLGEENPTHAEAFNEVPRDSKLAQKLSVSIDDISDYNDNLNQIQILGKQMVQDLKPLIKRIKQGEITPSQVTSDPQINEITRRYGFGSMAEMMSTQHSAVLPLQYLRSFAEATKLSIPQAKIFLYHAFGIQTE